MVDSTCSRSLFNLTEKKDWDEVRKFLSSGPTDAASSEDQFIRNILYRNGVGRTTLMYAVAF